MTTLLGILLALALALVVLIGGVAALRNARHRLRAPVCDDRGCATERRAREIADRSARHRRRLYAEMESIRRGRRDDGT